MSDKKNKKNKMKETGKKHFKPAPSKAHGDEGGDSKLVFKLLRGMRDVLPKE